LIQSPHRRPDRSGSGPLDYEIAQEKAAALGRLGRGLERALAALASFDAEHPKAFRSEEHRVARAALVERDACGLRDARAVMRDYRVPSEVQARAGALPSRRSARS
jgi:hypothetical protein